MTGELTIGSSTVHLQLKLPKSETSGRKVVEFDFDMENDTVQEIAEEMSEALNLSSSDQQVLRVLAKNITNSPMVVIIPYQIHTML